jgi:hypothetical protein
VPEKRVPITLPDGKPGEGTEVQVAESIERWSEIKLEDGSIVRAKLTVASAVRVDGQFDQSGNPVYVMNVAPVFTVVNVPEHLRQKAK